MSVIFTNLESDDCDAVIKITKHEPEGGISEKTINDVLLTNSEPVRGYSAIEPIILSRYDLPERYCIYTRGPFRSINPVRDKELLAIWYSRCLELAYINHCGDILIPLISDDTYPKDIAIQVAYDTCNLFLKQKQSDMVIKILIANHYLVPDKGNEQKRKAILGKFRELFKFSMYAKDHYSYDSEEKESSEPDIMEGIEKSSVIEDEKEWPCLQAVRLPDHKNNSEEDTPDSERIGLSETTTVESETKCLHQAVEPSQPEEVKEKKSNLQVFFQISYPNLPDKDDFKVKETFREMLLRLMNEKDMPAPEIYTKACMDRKLFSKIQSSDDYQPRKYTVVRLALALDLSLDETNEFMNNAGFALSHGKIKDLVIAYCIKNDMKSVSAVNEILEEWGLTTI